MAATIKPSSVVQACRSLHYIIIHDAKWYIYNPAKMSQSTNLLLSDILHLISPANYPKPLPIGANNELVQSQWNQLRV